MVRMAPNQPGCTLHTIYPHCTHIGGMLSLCHCTPYQQSTSFPLLPMASHIGPREYASPAPMRHHNPFPFPCYPWYPIFGPREYASPTPMRHHNPFPFPCYPWYPIFGPREYASPTPMRHHDPFPLFH